MTAPHPCDNPSSLAQFAAQFPQDPLGRGAVLELLLIAAIAREPVLLVGGPGSGKTMLLQQFAASFRQSPDDLLEYVLSKETHPAELFADTPGTHAPGTQPTIDQANWVHLQQIFHINSALQNRLLRFLDRLHLVPPPNAPSPLLVIGSVYDLEGISRTSSLCDRFAVKVELSSAAEEAFEAIIVTRLANECGRITLPPPPIPSPAPARPTGPTALPIETLRQAQLAFTTQLTQDYQTATDSTLCPGLDPNVSQTFQHLLKTLTREDRIYISDRRIYKLYKLMRARAWLYGALSIRIADLILLSYLGESREEMLLLRDKVPVLIERYV
jgi:MoxR-like ATPase